jgi:hypothetical protein
MKRAEHVARLEEKRNVYRWDSQREVSLWIILRWIWKSECGVMRTKLILLRLGTIGSLL